MRKKTTIKLLTFFLFAVLTIDIYAVITSNKPLEIIFKPLLITILAIIYLLSVKKPSFLYLSALLFSFWGDVLLLFKEKYFVIGLISFLIAHLFFIKLTSTFFRKAVFIDYLKSSVPFVLFFSGIIFLVKDNLGEMLIPIVVYGVVISLFGTLTLVNYLKDKSKENIVLLLGAIIFILSDSFIALNSFHISSLFYTLSIMATYTLAQYLICSSVVKKQLVS